MIEFPSDTQDFTNMKTIKITVDNVLNINVPFDLTQDEEDALVYAQSIKLLKSLIKSDRIQLSLAFELVD